MPNSVNKTYDEFPLHIVLLCNAVNISIYILGAFVIAPFGYIYMAIYIAYCLLLETRVMVKSCRDCSYYGKNCAFGKGRICSIFFKKGTPERFLSKQIKWLDILPDFLVSLIPITIGIISLFISFSWVTLSLIIVLMIIAFPVTGFIRSSIACKFCRQRVIGCPAILLFEKKTNK